MWAQVCSRVGLTSLAYLWHQPQAQLLRGMIEADVQAILVKVAVLGLDPRKHLGRSLAEIEPVMHRLSRQEQHMGLCCAWLQSSAGPALLHRQGEAMLRTTADCSQQAACQGLHCLTTTCGSLARPWHRPFDRSHSRGCLQAVWLQHLRGGWRIRDADPGLRPVHARPHCAGRMGRRH